MSDSSIGVGQFRECTNFKNSVWAMESPSILELGTLRWEENRSSHHKDWVPNAGLYVMSDIAEGLDVDVASDAHDLKEFEDNTFDAIIACSVWEHLARPWIAAHAAYRVLKPGGVIYVDTHQTFPLHGYPHDYFRFSAEALSLIFTDAGFTVDAGYNYPCKIIPPREVTRWNTAAECYLNVNLFGVKEIDK